MRAAVARIALGLVVFVAALALGVTAASFYGPERLARETERRLTRALGAPVTVGSVRVVLDGGLGLDGEDVRIWRDGAGWGLTAERMSVRIRPTSVFSGRPRLARMKLSGARLRLERSAEGDWSPDPFTGSDPDARRELEGSEALLSPLLSLERAARSLLERPFLADELVVERSQLVFVDHLATSHGDAPVTLTLDAFRGSLRHQRRRGAELRVRARVAEPTEERGAVEWAGQREPDGAARIAMALTDVRLATVAPWLRSIPSDPHLEGRVSGVLVYDTPTPGSGHLEVDLVGREVSSVFPTQSSAVFGPMAADRIELHGGLEISPSLVRLHDTRLTAGDLDLQVEGTVERPLASESGAQLQLTFHGVDVAQVRHIIGWLPAVERGEAAAILRPVRDGRMRTLRAGGEATLAGWQTFLAGDTRTLPEAWVVDAELVDALVAVGDGDRIEGLSGRLWWSGDRLEVRGATAVLNGEPLPQLDLTLDGVTHFLAVDAARRELRSNGLPLVGLEPLWRVLGLDEEGDEPPSMTTVQLDIERLEHPMFVWPIAGLRAAIEPVDDGLHILTSGGTLAGVPIRGDVRWLFEPVENVRVRLTASAAGADAGAAAARDPEAPWAVGTFSVGPILEKSWRQRSATGRFTASGGRVSLADVAIELAPVGSATAAGFIDLSRADAVPTELTFSAVGAEVPTLAGQVGLPTEVATGETDLHGFFRGVLHPDRPLFSELSGELQIAARGGRIFRAVPAIVAVALASQSINPFLRRDSVRYDSIDTILTFENERITTDAFSVDGPDVRVFASGDLGLTDPNEIDAKVAIYLFRQLDSVIGKIPIVNLLLLGPDKSLAAAYFEMTGAWEEPEVKLIPLQSLASVPGPSVIQGVQSFVMRGFRALGSVLGVGRDGEAAVEAGPAPAGS